MKRLSPLTVVVLFLLLSGFVSTTIGPRIYRGVQDFTGATVTGITGTTGPTGPTGPTGSGGSSFPVNTPANLWPMNEGSGNSFFDISSITANTATVGGTVTWSAGPGACYKCAHFGGTFDTISANFTNFNPAISSAYTISTWASFDSTANLEIIASQTGSVSPNRGWSLYRHSSGGASNRLFFALQGNSGTNVLAEGSTQLSSTATMYHVLVTYSGSGTVSGVNIYVNGVADSITNIQDDLAGSATPSAAIYLGGRISETSFRHTGYQSNTQLYNRVLSAPEIAALFAIGPLTTSWVSSSSAAVSGTMTIASGAKTLSTSAISSETCTSAQTAAATGTLTTDAIIVSFNGDPTAVTGYVPLTAGMLTIIPFPTSDTVNFRVCNNTSSSITPGAVTLNWRVVR